jgi:hypothetical protein
MTMAHVARHFAVSLAITHPNADPAEITKTTGLIPKISTRFGEGRKTPKGETLSGKYKSSYWTHGFDVSGVEDLSEYLKQFVLQLRKHKQFFRRITEENGKVELFCGVFADGNWDEVISHELMPELSGLRVDLRLDVYPESEDNRRERMRRKIRKR